MLIVWNPRACSLALATSALAGFVAATGLAPWLDPQPASRTVTATPANSRAGRLFIGAPRDTGFVVRKVTRPGTPHYRRSCYPRHTVRVIRPGQQWFPDRAGTERSSVAHPSFAGRTRAVHFGLGRTRRAAGTARHGLIARN